VGGVVARSLGRLCTCRSGSSSRCSYTYLYNATGCTPVFAPAFEQLILIQQEAAHAGGAHGTADVALLGTVVLAAALLTLAPRGRLGYRRHTD
jgi:hypothetical protein